MSYFVLYLGVTKVVKVSFIVSDLIKLGTIFFFFHHLISLLNRMYKAILILGMYTVVRSFNFIIHIILFLSILVWIFYIKLYIFFNSIFEKMIIIVVAICPIKLFTNKNITTVSLLAVQWDFKSRHDLVVN